MAVDLNQKEWAFRFGYFLEPKFSSSGDLDTLVFQRGGYQAEIEQRYEISSRPGRLRVLGFVNRALMGSYSRALTTPDFNIAQTRKDRFKTGFVLNLEQALGEDLGVFARFSYNDGSNQIMSFTDIDRSGLLGIRFKGGSWGRPSDTIGVAGVVNALSRREVAFIGASGLGILIGDGKLNYATENIIETYYRYQLAYPVAVTFDHQLFFDPALQPSSRAGIRGQRPLAFRVLVTGSTRCPTFSVPRRPHDSTSRPPAPETVRRCRRSGRPVLGRVRAAPCYRCSRQ